MTLSRDALSQILIDFPEATFFCGGDDGNDETRREEL